MTLGEMAGAGIFLLLSVVPFVMWEVYIMYLISTDIDDIRKVAETPVPKFDQAHKDLQMKKDKRSLPWIKLSRVVLFTTGGTALIGTGVLLRVMVRVIFF